MQPRHHIPTAQFPPCRDERLNRLDRQAQTELRKYVDGKDEGMKKGRRKVEALSIKELDVQPKRNNNNNDKCSAPECV